MSIENKLNYLNDTKIAIKNALIANGVTVDNSDSFRTYAQKIEDISEDGSNLPSVFGNTIPVYIPDYIPGSGGFVVIDRGLLYQDNTQLSRFAVYVATDSNLEFYWITGDEVKQFAASHPNPGSYKSIFISSGSYFYGSYWTSGFNGRSTYSKGNPGNAFGYNFANDNKKDNDIAGIVFATHDIKNIQGNIVRKADSISGLRFVTPNGIVTT